MIWRNIRFGGVVMAAAATLAAFLQSAPAHAQGIERSLAGIRLNSSSKTVLLKYGNPDEVVVGTVGVRLPPQGGRSGGGAVGGFGGATGGYPGAGGGLGAGSGAFGRPGEGEADGSLPGLGGGPGASLPGVGGGPGASLPGGGSGYPGGGGFGGPGGAGGDGIDGPSFGGRGGGGGFGGGASGVGRTVSTLARQQEVTWIYNRSTKNKKGETEIVSYEFLIGPNGNVSQIRVSGYTGGNARTQRGITLGSTYQQMIRAYGFHQSATNAGSILLASYRKNNHAEFQLLASRNANTNALRGYKVVAITIATVE